MLSLTNILTRNKKTKKKKARIDVNQFRHLFPNDNYLQLVSKANRISFITPLLPSSQCLVTRISKDSVEFVSNTKFSTSTYVGIDIVFYGAHLGTFPGCIEQSEYLDEQEIYKHVLMLDVELMEIMDRSPSQLQLYKLLNKLNDEYIEYVPVT